VSDELERLEDDAAESRGELDDRSSADETKSLDSFGSQIPYSAGDRGGGLARVAGKFGRKSVIGGALAAVTATAIVGMITILGGSTASITVLERFAGPYSGIENFAMRSRLGKNMIRGFAKSSDDGLAQKLKSGDFDNAIEKQGTFKLVKNTAGETVGIQHIETGRSVDLGQSGKQLNADMDSLFRGNTGTAIAQDLEKATNLKYLRFRGKIVTSRLGSLGLGVKTWLKAGNPDDTPEERLKQSLDVASEPTSGEVTSKSKGTTAEEDEANKKAGEVTDSSDILNEELNPIDELNAESNAKKLADAAAAGSDDIAEEILKTSVTSAGSTIGAGIASGLNFADAPQKACQIKGLIDFTSNYKRMLLSIQLARLAVRFLTVADEQKAGLINTQGLSLFMNYMNTPNPANGKSWMQSGGMQSLLGNPTPVNKKNLSSFSQSSQGGGYLSSIVATLGLGTAAGVGALAGGTIIPVPITSTSCKVVNNSLVQAAGFVVGVGSLATAVFGTGTTSFNRGQFMLGLFYEAAFQAATMLAKPTIIRLAQNEILDAYAKDGERGGDAIAAGLGSFRGSGAGSRGLRVATKQQAAALRKEYEVDRRIALSRQGTFERYLDPHNSESMLTTVAISSASSINVSGLTHLLGSTTKLFNFGWIGSAFSLGGHASAQEETESQCDDPALSNYETDAFCNPRYVYTPDLDPLESLKILADNDLVDDQDQPKGEFSDYVEKCFSGSPNTAVTMTLKDDGTGNAPRFTDECIKSGDPLPGDTVGRYDRFTAYYGYIVDITDLLDEPTSQLAGTDDGVVIVGNTSTVPCVSGTTDAGEADGYSAGQKYRIRLCEIPGFTSASTEDINGFVRVNSTASGKWLQVFNQAKAAGINLTAIGSFRTMSKQISLYGCYKSGDCNGGNEAAKPGYSNHQIGFAIDIDINTAGKDPSLTTCKANPGAYPTYKWLAANAPPLGIDAKVSSECWHWSVGGN
jgi:hypothetical protein